MSISVLRANPHAIDATVNQTIPSMKIRRRPNRSPNTPPSSTKAANVRVYPFTTHCS